MKALILVGIGGAAGSIARFGVANAISKMGPMTFPLATFGINIVGSFIIGLLFGLSLRSNNWVQQDTMLVLATGFCGGFTTFSTFAYENISLMQKGQSVSAILYSVFSVVCGLLLCRVGLWLTG